MSFENIQIPFTGLFWVFCVILGLYLLFIDNVVHFDKRDMKGVVDSMQCFFENFFELVFSKLNLQTSTALEIATDPNEKPSDKNDRPRMLIGAGIFLLLLTAGYICGIYSKALCGIWMNNGSKNHTNIKFLWASQLYSAPQYSRTTDEIMRLSFIMNYRNVNPTNLDMQKVIEIYNFSRYSMQPEAAWMEKYKEYKLNIENASSYAASFFSLMVLTLLNFIIYTTRLWRDKHKISIGGRIGIIVLQFILAVVFVLWQGCFYDWEKFRLSHCLDSPFSTIILIFFTAVWIYGICGALLLIISRKVSNYRLLVPLAILVFSLGGYYVSGKAWFYNNLLLDNYVFNSYKTRFKGHDGLERIKEAEKDVYDYYNTATVYSEKDEHKALLDLSATSPKVAGK